MKEKQSTDSNPKVTLLTKSSMVSGNFDYVVEVDFDKSSITELDAIKFAEKFVSKKLDTVEAKRSDDASVVTVNGINGGQKRKILFGVELFTPQNKIE